MSGWKFKRDTAFRKLFFVPASFAHPAKMDTQLLIKIVETYTKAGGEHIFTNEMLQEADKQVDWCGCNT